MFPDQLGGQFGEVVTVSVVEADPVRGQLAQAFLKALFPGWEVEWGLSAKKVSGDCDAVFVFKREAAGERDVPVIRLSAGAEVSGAIALNGDPPEVIREAILSTLGWETVEELPLTVRQKAVFRLAGRGWTLSEIATRLGLSPKTVESHFENIKNKLNLRSNREVRTRARQYLFENEKGT